MPLTPDLLGNHHDDLDQHQPGPAPSNDELLPEIADVRDWAAEAAHAELRKSEQNLERGSGLVTIWPMSAVGPKGDIRIAADFLIRSPRRRWRAGSTALRDQVSWQS
jgi:hypothetical protein